MPDVNEAGGPAFPVSIPGAGDNGWHGMSLRDWFAGQAVGAITAGLIAEQLSYGGRSFADAIAINVYEIADAMIKERALDLRPLSQQQGGK